MISIHLLSPIFERELTLSASFTLMSEQPETQHFPQPRATTAAWEVMPPLAVSIPTAACMPPTSSGLVSVLTFTHVKGSTVLMQAPGTVRILLARGNVSPK